MASGVGTWALLRILLWGFRVMLKLLPSCLRRLMCVESVEIQPISFSLNKDSNLMLSLRLKSARKLIIKRINIKTPFISGWTDIRVQKSIEEGQEYILDLREGKKGITLDTLATNENDRRLWTWINIPVEKLPNSLLIDIEIEEDIAPLGTFKILCQQYQFLHDKNKDYGGLYASS